jgi:hypothetical protein
MVDDSGVENVVEIVLVSVDLPEIEPPAVVTYS